MTARFSLLPSPENPACVAEVLAENRAGHYTATETLDIPGYGAALFHYETIGGHRPGDDDLISVVSLPADLIAIPMEAAIRDGSSLVICLMQFLGGCHDRRHISDRAHIQRA